VAAEEAEGAGTAEAVVGRVPPGRRRPRAPRRPREHGRAPAHARHCRPYIACTPCRSCAEPRRLARGRARNRWAALPGGRCLHQQQHRRQRVRRPIRSMLQPQLRRRPRPPHLQPRGSLRPGRAAHAAPSLCGGASTPSMSPAPGIRRMFPDWPRLSSLPRVWARNTGRG